MNALPITFDALRRDRRVKGFPFQVAEYLHRFTKRCYDESFTATRTIATYFGVDDRTVQRALKCLSLAGYLVVIRDHALSSRHRIRMIWRAAVATVFPSMRPAAPEPCLAPNPSENGNAVASPTATLSPSVGVPPDPPLKVSEDGSMGGRTDEPAAGDPACGHPAPVEAESSSPPRRSLPPEDEEPEPEVVARLVQEAAPILKTGPDTEGKVRAMARKYAPEWIRKALGITAKKASKLENPVGYTFGVLGKFEREGLPVEVPAPSRTIRPTDEQKAIVRARMAARRNARGGGSS